MPGACGKYPAISLFFLLVVVCSYILVIYRNRVEWVRALVMENRRSLHPTTTYVLRRC